MREHRLEQEVHLPASTYRCTPKPPALSKADTMDRDCRHVAEMAFELCRPLRAGVSGYLLVDVSEALDQVWLSLDRKRYSPIESRRSASVPLTLLRIRDQDDPLIADSLDCSIAQTVGASQAVRGWLYVADSEDLDLIVRRLARCLVVPDAAGREVLLRWYDPRVLEHLPSIFAPAQWAYFRRGIRGWATLDRGGTLEWAPDPAPDALPCSGTLGLNPAQMQRLERLGAANTALSIHAAAGGRVDAASRELADQLVARYDHEHASGYMQDRVLFAVHGLQIHPRFDRHPAIARALRGVGRDGAGIAGVLNAIDTDAWKRVVLELDGSPDHPPTQGCLE